MNSKLMIASFLFIALATACNNEEKTAEASTEATTPNYKEEAVRYLGDSANMIGWLVYDANNQAKRPAVIVVPEWWGLNDYPKKRARQLAELGYVAMAIDVYGDGKTADNPDSAQAYATPFYMNPAKAKARIDAAIAQLKTNPMVDGSNVAAIGYCFGGGVLLNTARLGTDLKGVVSFHGSLIGTPANKDLLKTAILVCHGAADTFVPAEEITIFKKQMDSIGAKYTFKSYDSAKHAFTNPVATETGQRFNIPVAYNAAADTASWNDMKVFLGELFGAKK
ncbi:MAG: dienelactone hydrolase family protein [Chitinophagaceae bacterium]|nr:dienelactone hydrolase family protein [Chitinophagaceae bacterium]